MTNEIESLNTLANNLFDKLTPSALELVRQTQVFGLAKLIVVSIILVIFSGIVFFLLRSLNRIIAEDKDNSDRFGSHCEFEYGIRIIALVVCAIIILTSIANVFFALEMYLAPLTYLIGK